MALTLPLRLKNNVATNTQLSRLMALPQELRDMIFSYCCKLACITEHETDTNEKKQPLTAISWQRTAAYLDRTIFPEAMLVSRTFSSQYHAAVFPKSVLHVIIADEKPSFANLQWKNSFPLTLLRQLDLCKVSFEFNAVGRLRLWVDEWGRYQDWINTVSVAELQNQKRLDWTPTRDFTANLRRYVLRPLDALLSDKATLDILVDLSGYEPMEYPYYYVDDPSTPGAVVALTQIPIEDYRKEIWWLDLREICELSKKETYTWPMQCKLRLSIFKWLPLYQLMPTNWAELIQNARERKSGETQDVELPVYLPAREHNLWQLTQGGLDAAEAPLYTLNGPELWRFYCER